MAPDKLASGPQGYQQHPQHQQNQPHPLQAIAATDTAAAATAAATDDSKVKRARRSKPKVKTGCNNCKQRRIKCDEMRPACTQCTRAKKPCSGYPPPARPRLYEEVPIAPKPILAAPSLAAASSSSLPLAARSLHPLQLQQTSLYPPTGPQHRQMQYQQQYYPQYQQQYQQSQQSQLTLRRVHKLHIRNYGIQFTYAPSLTLPLSPQHGMYFNLFRQHTASELSGFFDDVFWSRTVLIECHQADAIRHAVVALGALYKTLETTTESPPSSPDAAGVTPSNAADRAANHWEVALDQYSSACHAVGTVDPANPRSQRTCLIASVLLACFDSFIGDHQQAIRQIQTGLKQLWLLRDSRNSQTVLQVAPDGSYVSQPAVPEPVEDELLQMFTRLAIQAKSYDMAFHFPKPYVIYLLPSTEAGFSELSSSDTSGSSPSSPAGSSDVDSPVTVHQDPIPVRFSSLRDARLAWDTLCEDMLRFTEKMFQSASGPPNILPSSMRRYGIHFQARLTGWSAAFGPLLSSRTRPDVSSQEKAGIAVLKMFQIMGQILFFMTFVDSEMQFDNFQPHFAEIVSLAFEVVGDEEQRAAAARCPDPKLCAHQQRQQQQQQQYQQYHPYHQQYGVPSFGPSHIKASFSADLGIVPPLYVVATKSRDRLLRRQAIQLLRSSARREGMWDSELMARIGTWVMEIEERGDGEEDKLRSWQNSAGMPLTPVDSPAPSTVTLPHRQRSPGVDFGDAPLGPGGNARWDVRRESSTSSVRSSASATSGSLPPAPPPIPAEKRVLVKSCEFDLRGHVATLKCGTRGLVAGKVDHKTQVTRITW